MDKSEFAKLPKIAYPKPAPDVAKKFYAAQRPDPHLAPGLLPDNKRGACSPLGGLALQPKKGKR
jgi:hypothetical protein